MEEYCEYDHLKTDYELIISNQEIIRVMVKLSININMAGTGNTTDLILLMLL